MLGTDPLTFLYSVLIKTPGILIGLAFHEFAHAYASDRLGDPTPRLQGRLTLSPLPHIDILGLILILFAGFGWAKPVQVNPRNYHKPRRDEIIVSIAGPFMNLLLAVTFGLLLKALYIPFIVNMLSVNVITILGAIFDTALFINLMLFIFNLLPVPPLDGYHVLANLISYRHYNFLRTLEQYGSIILILLIVTPVSRYIIQPPITFLYNAIATVLGLW